ncbi:MAG: Uncharacterised protein [Candidatus Poseidoniaceae archaeon]|nr:MAG: Uncharacterised protein [Candidatus Poseidoniaceae archaeon]
MGHCPLEKNGVRAQGDVFRASERGDASGSPDAVVAVHHRRCWRMSDHGFSVIQRFFAICPWIDIFEIPHLRHWDHEDNKDNCFVQICRARAGHTSGSKSEAHIALSYHDRFQMALILLPFRDLILCSLSFVFLDGFEQGHCKRRGLVAMHPIVDAFPRLVTFCQYSPYVGLIPLRIEPITPVQSVVSGWAQVHFGFVVRFHGPIHPSLAVRFAVRRD